MELKPYSQGTDVMFKKATVTFPAFDYYKEQAEQIAEYIDSIELTEENVKEVKKDLAGIRKITDELSDRRIGIKKKILEDFEIFNTQVKEITDVISDAENNLRLKVKILEEREREEKKQNIRDLWNKRITSYQIKDLMPNAFDRWLSPSYLNKTASMKKIESDMITWLEKTENDITVLKSMDSDYLVEYLDTLDVSTAIKAVDRRRAIKEAVQEPVEEEEVAATFIIKGDKEIKLTELLLKENGIKFIRR